MSTSDQDIGRNLSTLRGEMSQRELANRMRGEGWKWTHLTVASVERGERPLRLAEADALSSILDHASLYALTSSEDTFGTRLLISRINEAINDLSQRSRDMLALQRELANTVAFVDLDLMPDQERDEVNLLLGYSPVEVADDQQTQVVLELEASEGVLSPQHRHLLNTLRGVHVERPAEDE